MIQPTVIVIRLSYGKTLNPLWIHYEGTPIFWIYRLPTSTKITKSCKVEGTTRSTDIDIEGAGILYTEDGCKVFSESFLLLSTASGSTNFTLTPGQVVAPELPNLLSEEESQVLQNHQDQADGTLGALDVLMTRSLTAGQQRELSLRDLLNTMQHDQHEHHYYKWLIAAFALILILPVLYLTSKCWRSAARSHIKKMQVLQSKCLRIATIAHWFICNGQIHDDFGAPYFSDHFRFLRNSTRS